IDVATGIPDEEAVSLKNGGVIAAAEEAAAALPEIGCNFLHLDGIRYVPIGIEDDLFHLLGDDGRLLVWLAGDDTRGVDGLAVLDHAQQELGNVDGHVKRSEVVRQPTPAFHIDENGVDTRLAPDRPRLLLLLAVEHAARAGADQPIGYRAV